MEPPPFNMPFWPASLHDRLAQLGASELVSTINKIQNQGVVLSPQTDEGVTYAPKITKQQACIDWSKSALQLDREIRAFNPWPVAYTWLANGQRLRLWAAQPIATGHAASPGTIVRTLKDAIDVATGNGILRLLRVQRAGGRIVSVSEFIRAYGAMVAPGQTLRGS